MSKTIYNITAMKFEDPKDGEAKVTAKYKELNGAPPLVPPLPAPHSPASSSSPLQPFSPRWLCTLVSSLARARTGPDVSVLCVAEEIQSKFRSLEDL
jgi:hypothetical protein